MNVPRLRTIKIQEKCLVSGQIEPVAHLFFHSVSQGGWPFMGRHRWLTFLLPSLHPPLPSPYIKVCILETGDCTSLSSVSYSKVSVDIDRLRIISDQYQLDSKVLSVSGWVINVGGKRSTPRTMRKNSLRVSRQGEYVHIWHQTSYIASVGLTADNCQPLRFSLDSPFRCLSPIQNECEMYIFVHSLAINTGYWFFINWQSNEIPLSTSTYKVPFSCLTRAGNA